jgi:hypothetical protein
VIRRDTHLAARLEPEAARALFDGRRLDMLNAWRQYIASVPRKEAAQEVIGTANAMAGMLELEARR